jgi:hypothetical protein
MKPNFRCATMQGKQIEIIHLDESVSAALHCKIGSIA